MGPPLSTWPYSHPSVEDKVTQESDKVISDNNRGKCLLVKFVDNFRVICLNFTFVFIILQVVLNLSSVGAGPVILNLDYLQGPVPLARNIRHLPCISRRSGQEGLCMFAIDCLKANGSHLGTCIDRFYFGSCCQIPDKTILPQIIGNNIDDNTIDSANFVHPQTEDKVQSTVTKLPELFTQKTTEKVESVVTDKAVTVADRTDAALETKSDESTTIDNKILNDEVKLTTASIVETTVKAVESKTSEIPITEIPIKLSTFQTVSDVNSDDKPQVTTSTTTLKPTRKPVRPTFKPRPTYRPSNFTRPQYTSSTSKPRPTKPSAVYNSTRKPPYRNPPKRPSTRKPLPSPPRLNITILPQSTSSKPIFTRPSSVSITYINTTVVEDKTTTLSTTTTSSTTPSTTTSTTTPSTTTSTTTPSTTTSTTTPSTTTSTTTPSTTTSTTTERITETTEVITETPTTEVSTEKVTEKSTEPVTEKSTEKTTVTETPLETTPTEVVKETTIQEEVTEKETLRPATEADIPIATPGPVTTTTEFPPLVTWTNTVDTVTKTPEKVTESPEETWSPVTPPEGWVLISSIPPTPEPSTTTTTTTTTSTTTTTTESPKIETTEKIETTSIEPKPTTQETTSTETTSSESTQEISEFTVNVTLSPTVPTSTSSMGLTTFTLVTSNNVTGGKNDTEAVTTLATSVGDNETSSTTAMSSSTTETIETTTDKYNMSNYKDVCGRRLWQAPTGRIVGGVKSAFGQWPWQISLRQYRTSTYLHKCGAALLNENWAITAAHCVEHVPPSELLVRLGEHDLASEDEPYGFAERRVQIVASHPHFDPATFEYDLALLRFYEPVSFQPNILPVCVPDDDDDYVGKTAYVTGWGRLFDEGPLPSVLQEVTVPVINNSACEAMYQAAGYNEHIPNIFICAGRSRGGTDSCEGDSGGPMVVQRERDDRFVLGGVISWGIGCAEPNQPGVYTRISEFRDWINQILQF